MGTKGKLIEELMSKRKSIGSVDSIKFDKRRCRILNRCEEVKEKANSVIYWMQRDCRVQDNWALLFAQKLALKNKLPLHVCFFTYPIPNYYPTPRQYKFLLEGLSEVRDELQNLDINFYLINKKVTDSLVNMIEDNNVGALICDFDPLRQHRNDVNNLTDEFPVNVPLIQVDAHNIVPVQEASGKQERAARTIRPKINRVLDDCLTEFPEVMVHPYKGEGFDVENESFKDLLSKNLKYFKRTDLPEITWTNGGYSNGVAVLETFIKVRLARYNKDRNEPSLEGQSNLSPWLHFGQISAQRCALEVRKVGKNDNVDSFLEELIIRRELAENFCFYNDHYDTLAGADKWARETLELHRKDKRQHIYKYSELELAKTIDPYWNSAQTQLRLEGKMHGYMRMYWCKKILEWTSSPEEAIEFALRLNDELSLDGSDPNGFVGVMWSVCGTHDHGWKERDIFGKIRYMADYCLAQKFDLKPYCRKYTGEVVKKSNKRFKSK